jgi:hypothetical protein
VRFVFALTVAVAALGAPVVAGASAPSYALTFTGSGSEHLLDQRRTIEDDGSCELGERVDVTARFAWSTSWPSSNLAASRVPGRRAQIAGSHLTGSHVRDTCGEPLDEAPEGWVSQQACNANLAIAGPPRLSHVRTTATSVLLEVAAPSFAVPGSVQCPLTVRNDQLVFHLLLPLKKLQALRKHASLTFAVGTARPGPGDVYSPSLDCSQPTKPYEGYRTADHCLDALTWRGSVQIKRLS